MTTNKPKPKAVKHGPRTRKSMGPSLNKKNWNDVVYISSLQGTLPVNKSSEITDFQIQQEMANYRSKAVYHDGNIFMDENAFRWWVYLKTMSNKTRYRGDLKIARFIVGSVIFIYRPYWDSSTTPTKFVKELNKLSCGMINNNQSTIVLLNGKPSVRTYTAFVKNNNRDIFGRMFVFDLDKLKNNTVAAIAKSGKSLDYTSANRMASRSIVHSTALLLANGVSFFSSDF